MNAATNQPPVLSERLDQLSWAGHNPLPGSNYVANINIDMPILLYDFEDIIGFGSDHSSLGETLSRVAAKHGIEHSEDPVPERSLFVRSDHYRFVRKGVPSLFLFTGFKNGGDTKYHSFTEDHYHQPSDDTLQPIRYDQAARLSELASDLVTELANADEAPSWNNDSLFKPHQISE